MPSRRGYTGSRSKQRYCLKSPPCSRGMRKYKMRKSLSHCCRKKFHHRVGPTYYSRNKWVKFLKKHGGSGHSRSALKRLYARKRTSHH